MASFKILSRSVMESDPQTHVTVVEYTFDDLRKITVQVDHFQPKSLLEVRTNIENRGKSEWARLVAIAEANVAGAALDPYINQSITFSQI